MVTDWSVVQIEKAWREEGGGQTLYEKLLIQIFSLWHKS